MNRSLLIILAASVLFVRPPVAGAGEERAPTGYYIDPSTEMWHYYDGIGLFLQPPGFSPPAAELEKFDLYFADRGDYIGWELHIGAKFVGSHDVHFSVRYEFVRDGAPYCPGSQAPPPCYKNGTVQSRKYQVGPSTPTPTILSVASNVTGVVDPRPNAGTASAWGWLDDAPQEIGNARYSEGPISW